MSTTQLETLLCTWLPCTLIAMAVLLLLKAEADVNARNGDERETALIKAVSQPVHNAHLSYVNTLVEDLLKANADVHASRRSDGAAALHEAAANGRRDIVHSLLTAHAFVDIEDDEKVTPLMDAAVEGRLNVVHMLIDARADVNKKHHGGVTALYNASSHGHACAAQLLLTAGASANSGDRRGGTPLHCAAEKGYHTVVQKLLEWNANVTSKTVDGFTPLHIVAKFSGCNRTVQALLKASASAQSRDANDRIATLLQKAQEQERTHQLIHARAGSIKLRKTKNVKKGVRKN